MRRVTSATSWPTPRSPMTPGAVLAVHSADCAGVVLARDRPQRPTAIVGAAHAGWRGLESGVLQQTVQRMRDLGGDAFTWDLGPCISPGGLRVRRRAPSTSSRSRYGDVVRGRTLDGKPALDLRAGVRAALGESGRSRMPVTGPPPCTALDPGFYSWRARGDTGRQAAVVWLAPPDERYPWHPVRDVPIRPWSSADRRTRARSSCGVGSRSARTARCGSCVSPRPTRSRSPAPRSRPDSTTWARTTRRSSWRKADGWAKRGRRPRWHFIGRLQSNKVAARWLRSCRCGSPWTGSRWRTEIARRAPGAGCWCNSTWPACPIVAAVDPDGRPGAGALGAPTLGLDVGGLMGVGVPGPPEASRPGFRLLGRIADRPRPSGPFDGDERRPRRRGRGRIDHGPDRIALVGPRPDRPASNTLRRDTP